MTGTAKLGWYARRLGRMSPAEIAWRAREQAIRRAAVLARIPTITTLAAARAAAEGISALQEGVLSVIALQTLHADRVATVV